VEYRKCGDFSLSVLGLGTWAFGGDKWWGPQDDKDSWLVLKKAIEKGINLIDTAPVYGRGHSEEVIGKFLKKEKLREKVILATKVGLSWKNGKIYHNLKKKRMMEEIDESRKRLDVDWIDIYQVHWPDPDTPIGETAETMYKFYSKGLIKAIGVSNYSVEQMKEFMKYSPLHILQPPYNMFKRDIEEETIPFCKENKISIISYIPLHSGILTGKFFLQGARIPDDLCRKNHSDLKEPLFSINKKILSQLNEIASRYHKTLTQLVLNWTYHQEGITSILVGARKEQQLEENLGSVHWEIEEKDLKKIEEILSQRISLIKSSCQ